RTADVRTRRCLLLIEVHVPRRILARRVIRDSQPHRRGEHFLADRLIKDARHISFGIQRYAIVGVFERSRSDLELRILWRSFAPYSRIYVVDRITYRWHFGQKQDLVPFDLRWHFALVRPDNPHRTRHTTRERN